MIDVKNAVEIAKQEAAELLEQTSLRLEEIERESYKDRDVWSITLSFPRNLDAIPAIARLGANPLEYKRFLIDVETGKLLAIKLREVATT